MSNEKKFRAEMMEALEQTVVDYKQALDHLKAVHDRFHKITSKNRDLEVLLKLDPDKIPMELMEALLIPCVINALIVPKLGELLRAMSLAVAVTKNQEMIHGDRPFDPSIVHEMLECLRGKDTIKKDPFGNIKDMNFDDLLRRSRDCGES